MSVIMQFSNSQRPINMVITTSTTLASASMSKSQAAQVALLMLHFALMVPTIRGQWGHHYIHHQSLSSRRAEPKDNK